MKKNTNSIPSYKHVACPACKRDRLLRPLQEDGTTKPVSDDTVEIRGKTRYHDVCQFCAIKYEKADKRFMRENLRKIDKAMQAGQVDEESDHEDFSLDL